MRALEIYIHIPFCVRKCAYCDFLSTPASRAEREWYVKTLIEEICCGRPVSAPISISACNSLAKTSAVGTGSCSYGEQQIENCGCQLSDAMSIAQLPESTDYVVTSVFFGGGTPSVLTSSQIAEILDALRSRFAFAGEHGLPGVTEITIECNPGAIGSDMSEPAQERLYERNQHKPSESSRFHAYLASGINRISFGLQSADNRELAVLGRIHTWETFLNSYQTAREAGFKNINVDLMSALPGQTVKSWEYTLRQILALAPEHISAYSLIIEEGTPFYEKYHEDDLRRAAGEEPRYLPSEEAERRMAGMTEQMLRDAGYVHYEISNYACPGFECRHNIGYWRGTEYMGFGLGAASLLRYLPQERSVRKTNRETAGIRIQGNRNMQEKLTVSCPMRLLSVRCKNPDDFAVYERNVRSQRRIVGMRDSGERMKQAEGSQIAENHKKFFVNFNNMSDVEVRFARPDESENAERLPVDLNETETPEGLPVDLNETKTPEGLSVDSVCTETMEVLTVEDEMAEFMFLGLRMLSGISTQEFQTRFGSPIDEVYGDVIRRMSSLHLLERRDERIFLTPRGLDVSNQVMAEFLL